MHFMSPDRNHKKGFTLLEILISALILAIISFNAYRAFESFTNVEVRSTDRIVASDVISSELERVKRSLEVNPNSFTALTSDAGWVNISNPIYSNGFYSRRITYTPHTPQANITQAVVEVKWTDRNGNTKQAQHVFSLTQPTSLVYGNIKGQVFDNTDPANPVPLQSAYVKISDAPANAQWTINDYKYTDASGNYSFQNAQNKNTLPIGDGYRVKAYKSGFQWSTQPDPTLPEIVLPDTPDIIQDFYLTPSRATITGKLVNSQNNVGIQGKPVSFYENGHRRSSPTTNSQGQFNYNVYGFSVANPEKCFSVATGVDDTSLKDFPSYYVSGGQGFMGDFCGQSFAKGWSSAVMGVNPQSSICPVTTTNPWFGNASTESEVDLNGFPTRSVCVKAGDNYDIGNIELAPIQDFSTLTINVDIAPLTLPYVLANTDVTIKVQWGDGSDFAELTTPFTGVGNYSVSIQVPLLTMLGIDPNYMLVQSYVTAEVPKCCGAIGDQQIVLKSSKDKIIIDGITETITLDINDDPDSFCGDANGSMANLETGLAFGTGDCEVTIAGSTYGVLLSATGCNWSFHCCPACPDNLIPEMGVALADIYKIDFKKPGFYDGSSCGICAWPHKPVSALTIIPNTILYDGAGNITGKQINSTPVPHNVGIYRKGYGMIFGVVKDTDGNLVPGATVTLKPYCSWGTNTHGEPELVTIADANGEYDFGVTDVTQKVVETWPPNNDFNLLPAIVKPHMKNEHARHKIEATATRGSKTGTGSLTNILLNKDHKENVDIIITFPAGL